MMGYGAYGGYGHGPGMMGYGPGYGTGSNERRGAFEGASKP